MQFKINWSKNTDLYCRERTKRRQAGRPVTIYQDNIFYIALIDLGTVGGGAHQTHCFQILLSEGASRHRSSGGGTSGNGKNVCKLADKAIARDAIPRREKRDHGVERCCSSLDIVTELNAY